MLCRFASRMLKSVGVEFGHWSMNLAAVEMIVFNLALFVFDRKGYMVRRE
jgi:hypothetical protein